MVNKKGVSYTVVALIVALAVGIVLLLFTSGFASILTKGADRNSCRDSVVIKAFNPIKTGELNCRTNYISISTLDQKEIMQTVAEEAYWCWWQFKEGEADFLELDKKEIWVKGGINSWCFICSDISFSDKVKEKYPQGINNFDAFLQETSLKPKYDGSYIDYLPKPDTELGNSLAIIPTTNQFRIAFRGVLASGIQKTKSG